jgi:hypothetical protein
MVPPAHCIAFYIFVLPAKDLQSNLEYLQIIVGLYGAIGSFGNPVGLLDKAPSFY